jgi:integrase
MARLRGNKWQADAIVGGKRVRPAFNTREEAEAFEKSAQHMDSMEAASIGRLFPAYADKLWKSKRDYKGALSITNELIRMLGENTLVHRIDDDSVDALVEEWDNKDLADQSINNKLSKLSKLLKYARKKRLIQSLPLIELRPQDPNGRMRFLLPDEEKTLFAHMNEQDRAFCTFLLYTGGRFNESRSIEWRDVQANYYSVTFRQTKNGKFRTVPLTAQAKDALAWCKDKGFEQPFAFITSYTGFRQRWQTARNKTPMKLDDGVIPYVLRHTCASRLAQNGVDVAVIKEWMGHASINTTLRYAKLNAKPLEAAAAILEAA